MENNRYADEPHGYHDGSSLTFDYGTAKNDEWSRNEARDGTNATADERKQPGMFCIKM